MLPMAAKCLGATRRPASPGLLTGALEAAFPLPADERDHDRECRALDLGLPELDGLSVLGRRRAAGRNMPVPIPTARSAWHAKGQRARRRVVVDVRRDGRDLSITVDDDGAGIPPRTSASACSAAVCASPSSAPARGLGWRSCAIWCWAREPVKIWTVPAWGPGRGPLVVARPRRGPTPAAPYA